MPHTFPHPPYSRPCPPVHLHGPCSLQPPFPLPFVHQSPLFFFNNPYPPAPSHCLPYFAMFAIAPRYEAGCGRLSNRICNDGVLQDTHRTLMPAKQSATNGHVTLLKQKMLTAILRRLDCVLFDKLTAGTATCTLCPPPACRGKG